MDTTQYSLGAMIDAARGLNLDYPDARPDLVIATYARAQADLISELSGGTQEARDALVGVITDGRTTGNEVTLRVPAARVRDMWREIARVERTTDHDGHALQLEAMTAALAVIGVEIDLA